MGGSGGTLPSFPFLEHTALCSRLSASLSVSEGLTWLSAGVQYMPTVIRDRHFPAMMSYRLVTFTTALVW